MTSTEGNCRQYQFADGVPAAAKGAVPAGDADANADAAVGGDNFKDDVERGVADRIAVEIGRFSDRDEEDC